MNTRDFLDGLREFWKEFIKVKTGLVGMTILLIFVALAFIGPAVVPFPGATSHWRDIGFWEDNPSAAPPVWTNWLPWVKEKGSISVFLSNPAASKETMDSGTVMSRYVFKYPYNADKPPRDIVVRFTGDGQIPVDIVVTRPDGFSVQLYREQLDIGKGILQRVSVSNNCAQDIIEFIRAQDQEIASKMDPGLIKPVRILFSRLDSALVEETAPHNLKGDYTITVSALILNEAFTFDTPSIVVSGNVSGIMGTDVSKRDIFTGIVIGIKWALIIGLLTSILTVLVGVILGVVAAYFGGVMDWLLNRLYEFVYLMPVLPFLIVISAIFKPTIWTLIVIICVFFWTFAYKPVYSMALQIREETYIEASRALGSKRLRIIFRHIVPLLLPYSFAVMALSVPAVIVYEASVSLLGLGDATIVTWGQLLHDAFNQGAVINNLWWWVIPPGIMIAFMGMSFAFLGTALDKILHPKLKTR
jgi:peptide/nickel transport system permease protein